MEAKFVMTFSQEGVCVWDDIDVTASVGKGDNDDAGMTVSEDERPLHHQLGEEAGLRPLDPSQ